MKDWEKKIAFDDRLNLLYQYLHALKQSGVEDLSNLSLVNEFMDDYKKLIEIIKERKTE